jgi:hypothetical protein
VQVGVVPEGPEDIMAKLVAPVEEVEEMLV